MQKEGEVGGGVNLGVNIMKEDGRKILMTQTIVRIYLTSFTLQVRRTRVLKVDIHPRE